MGMILTDEPQTELSPLRPLGNGKLAALGRYILGLVVTVLVAYFSAQGAIEKRVTRVETIQEANFQEVLRTLDRIESELVRLRSIR